MPTRYLRVLPAVILFAAMQFPAITQAAELARSDLEPSTDETALLTVRDGGNRRELSLADIEALPLYETELRHFEGLEGRFTGVRLERLIADFGLEDARRLRLIAADDYTIFLKPAELRTKEYLLVTRFEGEPLARENLGPLMLIAPEEVQAVLSGSAPMTNWIWALVEIRAR